MKNVLNGNLKVWHLLVTALAVMLLTGGTIALADTDAINALFPQGTVLMASASATSAAPLTTPGSGKLEVLSVSFDVPAGRKADVQAVFSGFLQPNSGSFAYCFGEFRFDSPTGTALNPNTVAPYQLFGGPTAELPSQMTGTFTGFKKNLKPGNYVLKAYLSSSSATCNVYERNMNVLVNLR